MNPHPPPVLTPPSTPPARKQRPWILYTLGGVMTALLLVIATFAILLWWSQRPIKPVVLTEAERTTLEQKLDVIEATPSAAAPAEADKPDRSYTPGGHTLILSEREINGLLNENTELGETVRLEFARDAIHAYIAAPIPEDVPVVGGRVFRARGRFRLSLPENATPVAVLEDVTVYGVSLPNAWLGGMKGENLLADVIGADNDKPLLQGVKSLRLEPGALVLELEE